MVDLGILFAREGPCRQRVVWTWVFLRPSSSLKADHAATLVHPDAFEFERCGISKWEAPWSLKPMALVLRISLKLFSQTVLRETGLC